MEESSTEPASADDSAFDVQLYLRAIWRRRVLVLATAIAFFSAVGFYTLRQPKVYSATASVIIDMTAPRVLDNQVQDVMDTGGSSSYWYNHEYYETQHRVITSRAVASRVVDKLGLQNDAAFLGLESIKDPKLRAEAMRALDAADLLRAKIKVESVKDTRLVELTVEDLDPKRAALLANEVSEAYIAENLALKLRTTESASRWLEDRLVELEQQAKRSELAVYDFKREKDMLSASLEERSNMVSTQLTDYNGSLIKVRTRIAELKAKVDAIGLLRKRMKEDPLHWSEALPAADTITIQTLKLRYANQKLECAELTERYLPEHPKLAACMQKLHATEDDLARELGNIVHKAETELAQAVGEERNLAALTGGAKSEAFDVNKKQIEYQRLKREADNNQRLYDLVLKRLKDIELSGLLRTSNVRVLDPARPSFGPIRPNVRGWLMLGALLGLLAGLGLAVGLELLDATITSQKDIEQALRLPFLGMVPIIEKDVTPGAPGTDLYIHRQPKSTVAEFCRSVRTNLLFMSPDQPFRTMLVSSSGPQEGKSTTVINLGITMAQSGKRVLLMDTDMRRPRLHRAFGLTNDRGVSSLVVGDGTVDAAVKNTEVPNLFVLPCGPIPPNPAELLHTQAFRELLRKLREQYDCVLLDSPPIGAVADALVLSTQVDGVVVVLKAGATNRELARRAVRSLQGVRARLFGVVLNHVNLGEGRYTGYYSSYNAYGYYYREEKDEAA